MHLCYVDESGTSDVPGNTSHFVLAGISIPVWSWKECDRAIGEIKDRYGLLDAEIHAAWMLRRYAEQERVHDFAELNHARRRQEVTRLRNADLLRLQRSKKPALLKQTKKNYKQTECYAHLTYDERRTFVYEVARCVSGWTFARLFAECVDKLHFDPSRTQLSVDEQAFEQLVSRFEQYLKVTSPSTAEKNFGLLIHDNNETVARKHTELMQRFHKGGTLWTNVENIIETPLFVDSRLTSMVQVADVCCYALRRYLENDEEELFDLVFQRADRKDSVVVGIRHFTNRSCTCKICCGHRARPPRSPAP